MLSVIDPKAISIVKIAEVGSFTKAADELCITQPAISQHVRIMESELGVKLFDRVHNEIRLTSNGRLVVKYLKRMISLSNNMLHAIEDEKTRITSVSVGITHTVESSTIIEAIARYASLNDGLSIKIIADSAENLHRMLKNFELDFLIIDGRIDDAGVNNVLLGSDSLVLVTSPSHSLANKNVVTVEELKKESLILRLPDSNTRQLFNKALRKQNISIDAFNVILEIDNIATIKDLVRQNMGVSVLAKSACMDEIRKGKLSVLNIENLSMIRETNIIYSRDFEHPEVIQGVIQTYNEM